MESSVTHWIESHSSGPDPLLVFGFGEFDVFYSSSFIALTCKPYCTCMVIISMHKHKIWTQFYLERSKRMNFKAKGTRMMTCKKHKTNVRIVLRNYPISYYCIDHPCKMNAVA